MRLAFLHTPQPLPLSPHGFQHSFIPRWSIQSWAMNLLELHSFVYHLKFSVFISISWEAKGLSPRNSPFQIGCASFLWCIFSFLDQHASTDSFWHLVGCGAQLGLAFSIAEGHVSQQRVLCSLCCPPFGSMTADNMAVADHQNTVFLKTKGWCFNEYSNFFSIIILLNKTQDIDIPWWKWRHNGNF